MVQYSGTPFDFFLQFGILRQKAGNPALPTQILTTDFLLIVIKIRKKCVMKNSQVFGKIKQKVKKLSVFLKTNVKTDFINLE
jgi:hypothetical protein